jgi:ABC-type uncharacterized transport system substrate-binding protein
MNQRAFALSLCLAAGLAGTAAHAHPHIFIDTRIEVLLDDQNRAVGVRIDWVYDELFSLSEIANLGLDADWDGKLSPEEEAALSGFDMKWVEGFQGDTYALLDDAELVLGPPQDWSASYDGTRITSTHLRMLAAPVDIAAATLYVQAYDPGFYSTYAIAETAKLTGGTGACTAEVWGPDIDAADEALKAALSEYGADENIEMDFPSVGKNFAEEVRVTCAAP